ncbi:MAG: bifunctional chorismate mutase/prephenate dehydrogenase [Rhodanobacteraceae bacterium]|nr:bifunctional chorismate mutase/prephenate dehydrogenase [Rhodanobacteraceae bacterium]MBP6077819.1 bifunctional chorismate mutase/prephenate dehydrogenase [Xanthomonadales bacterium]
MSIDDLRQQIDTLDRQLVDLLVERSRVTAAIGAFKRERGLALYVPERESELLNARREQAQAAGADPDMVEDVLRRVMRGSYASQETALPAVGDIRQPVVILGGRGAMGRLMAGLFERSGYPVRVIDVDNLDDLPDAVVDAGLVMVSVPIDRTAQVIAALPKLPEHCLLCDITSVKQMPLDAMLSAHAGPVVGLHPMFGPDVKSLVKQVIVVCHGRESSRCDWLLRQLEAWGGLLREESPAAHDQSMQMIQAMRHFTTIAYGVFLSRQPADLERLLRLSSPIYRLELAMVGRLFAQSPMLYADIMLQADHLPDLISDYRHALDELLALVRGDDREGLVARFRAVQAYFGDLAPKLLTESADLLRKMHDAQGGKAG